MELSSDHLQKHFPLSSQGQCFIIIFTSSLMVNDVRRKKEKKWKILKTIPQPFNDYHVIYWNIFRSGLEKAPRVQQKPKLSKWFDNRGHFLKLADKIILSNSNTFFQHQHQHRPYHQYCLTYRILTAAPPLFGFKPILQTFTILSLSSSPSLGQ